MKNKLLQHSFRKIKNNYKRFISLFCMSLLGVGFFSGIQSTSPNMIKTLDKFYDEHNVFDIEVISNLGLTENDKEALESIDNVKSVTGTYTKDVFSSINNKEYIIKLIGLNNNINKVYLEKGRLPKKDNEIIIENKYLKDNKLKIGDNLKITSDDISIKEFKIVGTVISPLYFSTDRGSTPLGNGKVDYYAYTKEDVIKMDYYTNIYITVCNAKNKVTYSDDYDNLIDNVVDDINSIKQSREDARYNEVYGQIIETANKYGQKIDKSKFERATWYVWTRGQNAGYKDLTDASVNVGKLGRVFPLVFYIIAILISLVSMKRMVDEDRSENGTLKALGFNNRQITFKYIVYSLLATISGGIIGMTIGFNLIPRIIWNIYKMLFYIPNFVCEFNIKIGLIGILIAIICITGTSIFVSFKNLREVPSTLMRPKAPKIGKKIFLERIKVIWDRLNFSNKVTIRNIFRYKGRVLATIIGISGCTALILAGFGLKDSLKDIANYQFNNVFHYDKMITLKSNKDCSNLLTDLDKDKKIKDSIKMLMENTKVKYKNKEQEVNLIVADNNDELKKVVSLNDIDNNKKEIDIVNDGVIISEKTSKLLKVNKGDSITIFDKNNKSHKVKVKYVIENYVYQYVYLTKNLYNELIGEYNTNVLMINMNNINKKESKNFNENIIKKDEVTSVTDTKEVIDKLTNMMEKLNSVVIILIVAATLLAFVILYNLSNINISERKREIATLKVLGFYNKEVDNYITKENIILTLFGITIGLFIGLYLCHFIISTCEPDYIMFVRHINLNSYIYASVITITFTVVVNIITHFNLKKIDMIESLKSNE